ncbi:MAG: hypothetical protein JST12_08930 [Armatimonadetes bacterium]|nr:hypothetical protein [Armatimonadota bacterium]
MRRHIVKLLVLGSAIALGLVGWSCIPTSSGTEPRKVAVMIGINITDSVLARGESKTVLATGIDFEVRLDNSWRYSLFAVGPKVQEVLHDETPVSDDKSTLDQWLNVLKPFPIPPTTKGTRSNLFFDRACDYAGSHPNTRVISILIGDGFSESTTPQEWTHVRSHIAKTPNLRGAWIGTGVGAVEEIERELGKIVTGDHPQFLIKSDLKTLDIDGLLKELTRE